MTLLSGKTVLVSGGTAGIGLAIAERALEDGARAVVVTGRDCERGRKAAGCLGGDALYLQQDATDEAGWDAVTDRITERYGHLDVLVNNAGSLGDGDVQDLETVSLDEWRHITAANVESTFLGCRAAIRSMKTNGGGAIVNMSSTAGLLGTPAFVAYGAAKAAIAHLTKSVAVHCARRGYGIRCNCVHPAIVDTSMRDHLIQLYGGDFDAARTTYLSRVPMSRFGTPAEVAAAVVHLASDESSYCTGAGLVIGGGLGV
jgi:NAD(P)-dependent dehydrogenase (short-subunit alcohol dehydrogenase family)